MYAMTRQEAQYDLGMVTGLLTICNMNAYILINSGSTHSFISINLSQYFDKMIDWLDSQLIISMPIERPFIADKVFRDCKILIENKILTVDLILIELIIIC